MSLAQKMVGDQNQSKNELWDLETMHIYVDRILSFRPIWWCDGRTFEIYNYVILSDKIV